MARHKFLFPFVLLIIGIFAIFVAGIFGLMHQASAPYFLYVGIASLLIALILFVVVKLREE